MSDPYNRRPAVTVRTAPGDTVEWTPQDLANEDSWFIKKQPARACCCGAATPGDWSHGRHHGLHRCAEVVTSIKGNRRVHI